MEGQWVDNAIWADTVTRSTLAELWSHRGHVATGPVPTRASNEGLRRFHNHYESTSRHFHPGEGPSRG